MWTKLFIRNLSSTHGWTLDGKKIVPVSFESSIRAASRRRLQATAAAPPTNWEAAAQVLTDALVIVETEVVNTVLVDVLVTLLMTVLVKTWPTRFGKKSRPSLLKLLFKLFFNPRNKVRPCVLESTSKPSSLSSFSSFSYKDHRLIKLISSV